MQLGYGVKSFLLQIYKNFYMVILKNNFGSNLKSFLLQICKNFYILNIVERFGDGINRMTKWERTQWMQNNIRLASAIDCNIGSHL